jgi:hypothetical protein
MNTYTVKTRFVFEGAFEVKAENSQIARRIVEKDCGTVLGGSIHTTNGEAVNYWNFPIHPEKVIVSVKTGNLKNKEISNYHKNNPLI